MFDKIIDFFIDYEDLINILLILFLFIFVSSYFFSCMDKQLSRDKNIIENTKNYVIHDNCKKLEDKYYCWENDKNN